MISVNRVLSVRCSPEPSCWSDRDVILYAMAIGYGRDPLSPEELPFIFERDLKVVPTFATVAAWNERPAVSATGVDYTKLVHAGQDIELHRPLPASATVRSEGGMTAVFDKGDKGAVIEAEYTLRDVETGEIYATNRPSWFARGDGNFGGVSTGERAAHPVPDRPADRTVIYTTRADQAALYRLLGDRNPLHIDPAVAARAGFARPILHGLCTFGITCRALLEAFAVDPSQLARHAARFAAPVLPGDELVISLWKDGSIISFEAHVPARSASVIRNGRAEIR
jgi:acyl dehydratase